MHTPTPRIGPAMHRNARAHVAQTYAMLCSRRALARKATPLSKRSVVDPLSSWSNRTGKEETVIVMAGCSHATRARHGPSVGSLSLEWVY